MSETSLDVLLKSYRKLGIEENFFSPDDIGLVNLGKM
jgi:hypothetical protein